MITPSCTRCSPCPVSVHDAHAVRQLSRRILAAYILYALYAPHPIAINPFRSALVNTFVRERDLAAKIAADGGTGASEQLVWVLWKILKGDGNDVRIV